MKRLLLALGLLSCVLAVVLVMNTHVTGQLESLLDMLDEAEWFCDDGDMEQTADQVIDALSIWEELSLPANILHTDRDVNAVTDKLALVYESALSGTKRGFKEHNAAAITAVNQLLTAHSPTLENIF